MVSVLTLQACATQGRMTMSTLKHYEQMAAEANTVGKRSDYTGMWESVHADQYPKCQIAGIHEISEKCGNEKPTPGPWEVRPSSNPGNGSACRDIVSM